jgi:hypothetical protein
LAERAKGGGGGESPSGGGVTGEAYGSVTSRDPGGPVADDGDLVDERHAAEHGGELGLGHLLGHLPHEQLHALPAARLPRRHPGAGAPRSRLLLLLLLLVVPVATVLRHWPGAGWLAGLGFARGGWLVGWSPQGGGEGKERKEGRAGTETEPGINSW